MQNNIVGYDKHGHQVRRDDQHAQSISPTRRRESSAYPWRPRSQRTKSHLLSVLTMFTCFGDADAMITCFDNVQCDDIVHQWTRQWLAQPALTIPSCRNLLLVVTIFLAAMKPWELAKAYCGKYATTDRQKLYNVVHMQLSAFIQLVNKLIGMPRTGDKRKHIGKRDAPREVYVQLIAQALHKEAVHGQACSSGKDFLSTQLPTYTAKRAYESTKASS